MTEQSTPHFDNKRININTGRDFEMEGNIVGRDNIEGDNIAASGDVSVNRIDGDQIHIGGDQYQAEKIIIHQPVLSQPLPRLLTHEEKREREIRRRIIEMVHYTWIDSILKPAIENDIYIDLGMSKQHSAVPQPGHRLLPSEEPLSAGIGIRDLFEMHGRKILILGEPASGKTITLLTLADELLVAAEGEGNSEPIPVVLNLASWARERADLVTWLGEEMAHSYKVGRDTAKKWAQDGRFILLLDGLDEVAEVHRLGCLQAINAFQANYDVAMVVCSRAQDYKALEDQLHLTIGVYLEKLSAEQMDRYLERFGADASGIRWAVRHNRTIQELGESPLMLSLMPLAYGGVSAQDLDTADDLEAGRHKLLETYVDKVFERRPLEGVSYTAEKAILWLSFIAQGLYSHSETIFHLEELQLTWLPTEKEERLYRTIYGRIFGLVFGLSIGLFVSVFIGLVFGLTTGLVGGLLFGLVFGLVFGLIYGRIGSYIKIVDQEVFVWPSVSDWRQIGITTLVFGLMGSLVSGLVFGLIGWLVDGLIFGLFGGLISGLIFGLIFGLIYGLSVGTSIDTDWSLRSSGGLQPFSVFYHSQALLDMRPFPNQGLWNRRKSDLLGGVIFGPTFGLICGLIAWLTIGLVGGLIVGLVGCMILAFVMIYITPLKIGSSHYSLRFALAKSDFLPFPFSSFWDPDLEIIAFLDNMEASWLLRRVGAGWVFPHRYLLEYFAERSQVKLRPVGKKDG